MWEARAQRARRDIAALAGDGLGVADLHAAAMDVVHAVVPYDQACWASVDPDSLMMTGVTNWVPWVVPPEIEARYAQSEYSGTEPNSFSTLLRRNVSVSRTSDLPHREVRASIRVNELLHAAGFEHEVRALFAADGTCWGVGGFFRDWGGDRGDYSDREVEFLTGVVPVLGAATRLAVRTAATSHTLGEGPVIVLANLRGQLRAATPAATAWLASLEDVAPGRFTMTLYAVVAGARSSTSGVAQARMRDPAGGWVVLQASRLIADDDPEQMVITVEPASGSQLARLLLAAYGLSAREQEVCLEVLAGRSTAQIAGRLFISAHTVQDHLKAVFGKVGVHTRGELTARLRPEE